MNGVPMPGVSAGSNQVGASVTCTPHVICPSGPAAPGAASMKSAATRTRDASILMSVLLSSRPARRSPEVDGPYSGTVEAQQIVCGKSIRVVETFESNGDPIIAVDLETVYLCVAACGSRAALRFGPHNVRVNDCGTSASPGSPSLRGIDDDHDSTEGVRPTRVQGADLPRCRRTVPGWFRHAPGVSGALPRDDRGARGRRPGVRGAEPDGRARGGQRE